MTYIDELKADYAYTPGVVSLTYTPPTGSATSGVAANIDAAGPSWRELQAGGAAGLRATDCVWIVWSATLASLVQTGTLTESGGTVWQVLSFSPMREEGTVIKWRCMCRKQE